LCKKNKNKNQFLGEGAGSQFVKKKKTPQKQNKTKKTVSNLDTD